MSTQIIEKVHLVEPISYVTPEMRYEQRGHKGAVFWFTGLSGAGKSTIAHLVETELFVQKKLINVLDGDIIRLGLCSDLSFSPEGRAENIRRIAELSRIMAMQGFICLCAFISPLKEHREIARNVLQDLYHEIYISCPVEECERRDVKGYYKLAREGKIKNYTGISSPYDIPENPDLVLETHIDSVKSCVGKTHEYILRTIAM